MSAAAWLPAPTCPGWWWRVQSWEGKPMDRCEPEMCRVSTLHKQGNALFYLTEDDLLYTDREDRRWEPVDRSKSRSTYGVSVTHLWSGPVPVPSTTEAS